MSRDDEETRAEDKDAYFVSYREVKVGKRVKVYLTKGGPDARRKQKPEEVLAAVGEDSGPKTGARFRNAANFTEHGLLDSDSRREVSEWLDGIVAEGLAREAAAGAGEGLDDTPFGGTPVAKGGVGERGAQAETDMDASAAAAATGAPPAALAPVPLSSMTFVNHSQEKFVFPDGRRGIRFYLVTDKGEAVSAAVGEERDTRDGHYTYRKDDSFARGPPLTCGNLIGVSRWLREQCVNGGNLIGAPLAGFGSHPPKRKNGGGGGGAKRGGGGGDGAPVYGEDGVLLSTVGGPIGALARHENSAASADPHWYADKKRKRDSRFFSADHAGDDVEPPSVATVFAERETRWVTSRLAAVAYVREDPDDALVAEITTTHVPTLRECFAFCAAEKTASKKQTKTSKTADERASVSSATRALETLRLLETLYVNARVLRETDVCAVVRRLKTHADATVRQTASGLLTQWLKTLQTHVGTMAATYERPPAPRAGARGGAARGAAGGAAGKPPRPKPVYDAAFIASRRNEPELRRTRESRDEVLRREAAERAAREAAAKSQREAAAARAAANKAAKAAAAAAAAAPTGAAFPGSPVAEKGAQARSSGSARDAPAEEKKERKSDGKKSRGASASAGPGTPLGKGRKLCTGCNTVVGSPTRVCPHCNATLPLKQTTTGAGSSPRFGGASGSGSAARFSFPSAIPLDTPVPGSSPPGSARADSDPHAFGVSDGVIVDGVAFGGAGDGDGEGSASVAHFLARHQERFASCKVSQLKRAVADLSAGVKRILDAGRVRDPALAKSLRESMKKMGDVKLLQGVVERPRARREVVAHLEAAIKACHARGA
jgi:hypothetical protein